MIQNIYRVEIKDIRRPNTVFDNYLIKVEPKELKVIEKHIHERYPNNILAVKFEAR
jgi:hypothetical protein